MTVQHTINTNIYPSTNLTYECNTMHDDTQPQWLVYPIYYYYYYYFGK